MLYNSPHAQLLLPAWPAPAADSAAAARRGGCQFAYYVVMRDRRRAPPGQHRGPPGPPADRADSERGSHWHGHGHGMTLSHPGGQTLAARAAAMQQGNRAAAITVTAAAPATGVTFNGPSFRVCIIELAGGI